MLWIKFYGLNHGIKGWNGYDSESQVSIQNKMFTNIAHCDYIIP